MVRLSDAALKVTAALAVLLAVSTFDGRPAVAQVQQQPDISGLTDRIDRLQRDVDVLQRQVARQRGGAPATSGSVPAGDVPSNFIDQTQGRFDTVDDQIRDLTDKIERLTNQVNQLSSRLDKLSKDMDFRLSALEKGGSAGAAAAGGETPGAAAPAGAGQAAKLGQPQVPPGKERLVLVPGPAAGAPGGGGATAPASANPNAVELPQGSPEAQYEFAYGLLLQAQREQTDFARPEQAFRQFLQANPNHRLAGNAQYWLGETFYARKDYQDAAAAFAEGLKKYPKSEKAADNLLKLGMTLALLNRKTDACGALTELNRRFPSAPPQIKTSAQRERTRLGCTG
jgi:tol-pal system protein YbgF